MEMIKKHTANDGLEVKPEGRIDIETAVEFGQNLNDLIDDYDIKNLTLDFSEIEYVSSIGLRVLLELQKRMNLLGSMQIINAKPEIIDIFNMTGFNKILNIV